MIPKIIWQTHEWEYKDLPTDIKQYVESWQKINPEWEYRYVSKSEREKFILESFGSEWLKIYNSYKFNVMKADLWRYLTIFINGGVYVDIDTICYEKLDNWFSQEYDFIVSTDLKNDNICQFIFAANKNTKIIECVLDLIKEEYINPKKYTKKYEYIANNTGYAVWNKAIKKVLEIDNKLNFSRFRYEKYNNSIQAKQNNFYCYGGKEAELMHKKLLEHLHGSINWEYDGHEAWQKKEWSTYE